MSIFKEEEVSSEMRSSVSNGLSSSKASIKSKRLVTCGVCTSRK